MPIQCRIRTNLYKDSVSLMRVAESLQKIDGIRRATLMMATPANLEILSEAGLLLPAARIAKPSDLLIVIDAESEAAAASAFDQADKCLSGADLAHARSRTADIAPRTISMGTSGVRKRKGPAKGPLRERLQAIPSGRGRSATGRSDRYRLNLGVTRPARWRASITNL